MSQSPEPDRINQNVGGEHPPFLTLKVVAKYLRNAQVGLDRVKQVMEIVSIQDARQWPSDSEWQNLLPRWFVEPFQNRDLEDILADDSESSWDYGSWLDAMRRRGWEWWSSLPPSEDQWEGFLAAFDTPYGIGPFEYLVLASGASHVEVTEL
jgi:hypothetical protein